MKVPNTAADQLGQKHIKCFKIANPVVSVEVVVCETSQVCDEQKKGGDAKDNMKEVEWRMILFPVNLRNNSFLGGIG